jgi:hypothetical protein
MRRGRKNSWRGEQWIVPQERREGKGGENRDKKIVMVKLIIQKKKKQVQQQQKVQSAWQNFWTCSFGI